MRIQWKITLLVSLVLVSTLAAVVWKTRALLLKDKLGFMADSSMKQISPLKKLVQERLDDQKSRLVRFAANRVTQQGAARSRIANGYDVIAMVQPSQNGQWAPSWIEKSQTVKSEQWPQGHETVLIKSLPYNRVKDGETIWVRVSDRQAMPVYAVMISVEIQSAQSQQASVGSQGTLPDTTDYAAAPAGSGTKAIVVGFTSANPLADVTENYIGSSDTVFLVDERGYIASHVNKAYLGALFTEDPIVQEIVKSKKTAASGNYEDLEARPVLGHFERIDRTNLYAVITSPLSSVRELVNNHVSTALTTGAAVGLLGLILAWLLGRSISQPLEAAVTAIKALNRGEPHEIKPLETKDEIGALTRLLAESSPTALASKASWVKNPIQSSSAKSGDSDTSTRSVIRDDTEAGTSTMAARSGETTTNIKLARERRAVYDLFNEGFTNAMKEPLLAILGHAQLTKTKATESTELRSHAESIEREARRAKDVLERLQSWSGTAEEIAETETMDLHQVVKSTFEKIESELKADDIEVKLDLHSVPVIRGSAKQMEKALGNLIENAREAMLARPKKKLKAQLDFLNDSIYLSIGDSGVGMSRDVKDKAFEPFYKAFVSPKRMGLGLSFVHSALERLDASCDIESSPGEGATFTMKFNVTSSEKQAFREQAESQLASTVAAQFKPETTPPSSLEAKDATASPTQVQEAETKSADAKPASSKPEPTALEKVASKLFTKTKAQDRPAGAQAAARVEADDADFSFDDDDDDSSEMFSNMNLKDAANFSKAPLPPPAEPVEAVVAEAGLAPAPKEFAVKIRRPKARS